MPHQTKILTLVSLSLMFNGMSNLKQQNDDIEIKNKLNQINQSMLKLQNPTSSVSEVSSK